MKKEIKKGESFKKGYQTGYSEGMSASHITKDGYCCACAYDILTMEGKIKEAEEKLITKIRRRFTATPIKDRVKFWKNLDEFIS